MKKNFYVYIMGNNRPTLYVGVTSDLIKRAYEHRKSMVDGFTKKYKLHKLLYFEIFDDSVNAITREKNIKAWKREWKLELIKKDNPFFEDLYPKIST